MCIDVQNVILDYCVLESTLCLLQDSTALTHLRWKTLIPHVHTVTFRLHRQILPIHSP